MVRRGALWLAFWHYPGAKVFTGFAFAEQVGLDGCLGVVAGEAWEPALPGTSTSVEVGWQICQTKCSVTPECARFTFLQNGTCSLHGSKALLYAEVLAISGPPACGEMANMQQPMPLPPAAAMSPSQTQPGLSTPQAMTKQLLGPLGTVGVVPPPTGLPRMAPDEQVSEDGLFLSWKALSALLLLACLLCAGLACCALWLYAKVRTEDADDSQEKGLRTRGSDFHLEEEVIYPEQTQIRWYPNIERHPSFVEDLLPKGLKASVDSSSAASSSTLGATTQRGTSMQSSTRSDRSHRSLTVSWHCRVGDSVEVFSKGAAKWIRCEVVSINGSRMTVAHGNSTRRINLRDRNLNSYFRLVTHNIVT